MERTTESERVQVLDLTLDQTGTSGVRGSRAAARTWWESAAGWAAGQRRRESATALRVEWLGDWSGDWASEENPNPPDHIDVIAATDPAALIRLRLERRGGTIARVGFELYDPSGRVTARCLRKIGEGGLLGQVDRMLDDWTVARQLGSVWRRQVHRPGRAGRPDQFYAEWAWRYLKALETHPRAPVKRLVEEERAAGRDVTPSQVRAYLNEARNRLLLSSAPSGQAGGTLMAKGRRILRRAGIEI